jgi:hypothetical protein
MSLLTRVDLSHSEVAAMSKAEAVGASIATGPRVPNPLR